MCTIKAYLEFQIITTHIKSIEYNPLLSYCVQLWYNTIVHILQLVIQLSISDIFT